MTENSKASEPADLALIEQIGVGRIAEALGISKAAVRKWRKTGVPDIRREAILALANAKQPATEQLFLVVSKASTPPSDGDDRHLASVPDTEASEDISKAPVAEGNEEPQPRENVRPPFSESEAQRQSAPAAKDSRTQPPPINKTSRKAMQERKPVRLNRQTAIMVGSGLVAAIAIGLTQGLRDVSSSSTSASEAADQPPIYQDHISAVLPDFDYRTLTQPAALTVVWQACLCEYLESDFSSSPPPLKFLNPHGLRQGQVVANLPDLRVRLEG